MDRDNAILYESARNIKNATYVLSQVTCAFVEVVGMVAENKIRESEGLSLAYSEADFNNVIEKYCIHHNGVVSSLNE